MPAVPRIRINPFLKHKIQASAIPHSDLAMVCDFRHPSTFSSALHAGAIPDSPTNIERWRKVAELVGFPIDQTFLDEPTAPKLNPSTVGAFSEIPAAPGVRP